MGQTTEFDTVFSPSTIYAVPIVSASHHKKNKVQVQQLEECNYKFSTFK